MRERYVYGTSKTENAEQCESEMLERLIRESERLAIARKYVSETKYPDKDILMAILGTEKAEGEE